MTQKLNQTHRRIAAMEREVLTNSKVMDPDFFHDEACDDLDFLTAEGIAEWNAAAFRNFAQNHPEFAITDRNLQILNSYYSKHSVLLFTTRMVESVHQRMLACGIQFDAPEAEAEVMEPLPYSQRPQANLTIAPAQQTSKQETFPGIDLNSGEPREYSAWELKNMSSEEMKRKLQLTVEKDNSQAVCVGNRNELVKIARASSRVPPRAAAPDGGRTPRRYAPLTVPTRGTRSITCVNDIVTTFLDAVTQGFN